MPPELWNMLLGPEGLLVGAVLAIVALLTGKVVKPAREFKALEERLASLESENSTLNADVVRRTEESSKLKIATIELTAEIKGLKEQLEYERSERRRGRGEHA